MSLAREIINGEHDDELEHIYHAIIERRKLRKKTEAAITMSEIEVGDTVILKDIRPKYLIGTTAEVIGKRQSKLTVRLSGPTGRFGMAPVIVPASCVEKINE